MMKQTTLSNLARFKEAVQARPAELAKARKSGAKVVGYFCSYVPEEIIHSLGLIPVRLCRGGDERLVELGARYASTKSCVFIRESVGLFADGKDPWVNNTDVVAVATTCRQIYRLAELIKYFFKMPTVVLTVPHNFYLPEGKDYFQRELVNFTSELEAMAGKKLDKDALAESVKLYESIRRALLEIYEFQARDSAPLSWKDVFYVIHAGFYLDRQHYLSLLIGLLEELKESSRTNVSISRDKRPRVLLSGSILAPGDSMLIDMIEEMGGRIVADDLCTGLRPLSQIELKDYSVAGIAAAYRERVPCASIPYLLSPKTDRRLANLAHLVEAYNAEGVVYHSLRFCDPFSFKAGETKNFLQDKVAFLEIHTEYAPSAIGPLRTRIEAFIELIGNLRSGKE